MDVKWFHVLVALVITVATATAGAIWKFAPITYAEETRQMVVEISLKDQLYYYEKKVWEYKKTCTDLKTGEWYCSDEDRMDYEKVLLEIKLLKAKLGIQEG